MQAVQAIVMLQNLSESSKKRRPRRIKYLKVTKIAKQVWLTPASLTKRLLTCQSSMSLSKEFKQVYPDSEFSVQLQINIRTSKDGATLDLSPVITAPDEAEEESADKSITSLVRSED